MYGPEYQDWRDETRVAGWIDEFLAALPAEDRVWALAVLRKRHTIYKDGPAPNWGHLMRVAGGSGGDNLSALAYQQQLANQRQQASPSFLGGAFGSLFG